MKVSILKESLCIGGTERSAANISLALASSHETAMVLFDGKNNVYPYGGTLYDLKLPAKRSFIMKVLNNIRRIHQYKCHIKEWAPDIAFQFISIHNPISSIKLGNCVKIISSRDYSVLCRNIKQFKKCLDQSDGLICNSQYLRDYYVSHYPEDSEKVFIVNNIIDIEMIQTQSKEPTEKAFEDFRGKHDVLLVSTGRFCKEKAFDILFDVLKQLRESVNAGLILVGDGELRSEYEDAIHSLGLQEHVFLTGYQRNPYRYMAKSDVFVLTSLSEGFPNVLPEAMALALPVISVNCISGPAEILMQKQDYSYAAEQPQLCDYGILVPHYDSVGRENTSAFICQKILELTGDRAMYKTYQTKSLERAKAFSSENAVRELERIFRLLKERKQSSID